MVKCLPTVWEVWVRSLGLEDPLEKEMATHSSTLAWKIPWMEEPGRLQSMGSQRVGHNRLHFHFSPKLSNRRCVPNSIEHVCAQNAGTKVFLVVPLVTALHWKGFQCPSAMGWDKSSVVISAPKENQP